MKGIRISTRYAKSLLDLCVERGEVDVVFNDMKLVHTTIDESRDLELMLMSPVIKQDIKTNVLNRVFGTSVSKTTNTFITLLTNKGREGMLLEVAASFVNQVKKFKNITSAEVVSAASLDDSTRNGVLAKAQALAGGNVDLIERIDSDLIGGFILRVGDYQLDTTVQSKIRTLRREFSENPYIPEL